jgi:hypothetical protein
MSRNKFFSTGILSPFRRETARITGYFFCQPSKTRSAFSVIHQSKGSCCVLPVNDVRESTKKKDSDFSI